MVTWLRGCNEALRPPPRLTGSEWAEKHFRLSAEGGAAQPGRWRSRSYQVEPMNAMTDGMTERVSFSKSVRVGATLILGAVSGYFAHHERASQFFVLPRVTDAEDYSTETYAEMIGKSEALLEIFGDPTVKKPGQKILKRKYPGGPIRFVGANSGAGFRRVSARVIIMDEVSKFPPSAGDEGDPVKLAEKRGMDFHNRKIIAVSTPTNEGTCRITANFLAGDRRRFHVACPHCGHADYLVFSKRAEGKQHYMQWPEGAPLEAHFVCGANGCLIEEEHKASMVGAGKYVAGAEFEGHASFHIWAAYTSSPKATWGLIAKEFLDCKDKPEQLRVFVNTVLGECWEEPGEAPEWEQLYARREPYAIGSVPDDVSFLTCGVDVHHDRFVYEVVGWELGKQSWSVEAGELYGDTADAKTYKQLDALLNRHFPKGRQDMSIRRLAIDSSDRTQDVYNWCRKYSVDRVMACKGSARAMVLVGLPKPVDVKTGGGVLKNGYKMFSTGVNIAKSELYGWLRMKYPADGAFPEGWCHFPEHPPEFFRQLTGEQLVKVRKRSGVTIKEWQPIPGRENHFMDSRILNRVAASSLGLDRYQGSPDNASEQRREREPSDEQTSGRRRSVPPNWISGRRRDKWF